MNKSALLIVDVQHDFLPGGALPTIARGVVPAVNTLLQEAGFEVIVASQDWHPEVLSIEPTITSQCKSVRSFLFPTMLALVQDHISFAATHGKASGETLAANGTEYQLFDQHCVQGTHGAEFPPNLDISKFNKVVQKGADKDEECFSAFCSFGKRQDTGLADWLKQHDVGHIYVAGVALETCVRHSVEDALQFGFNVSLVQDACAPCDASAELGMLQHLQHAGCNIISLDSAVQANTA